MRNGTLTFALFLIYIYGGIKVQSKHFVIAMFEETLVNIHLKIKFELTRGP